jgi:hypothetical protein
MRSNVIREVKKNCRCGQAFFQTAGVALYHSSFVKWWKNVGAGA